MTRDWFNRRALLWGVIGVLVLAGQGLLTPLHERAHLRSSATASACDASHAAHGDRDRAPVRPERRGHECPICVALSSVRSMTPAPEAPMVAPFPTGAFERAWVAEGTSPRSLLRGSVGARGPPAA